MYPDLRVLRHFFLPFKILVVYNNYFWIRPSRTSDEELMERSRDRNEWNDEEQYDASV